jgi:hypothetical protein
LPVADRPEKVSVCPVKRVWLPVVKDVENIGSTYVKPGKDPKLKFEVVVPDPV